MPVSSSRVGQQLEDRGREQLDLLLLDDDRDHLVARARLQVEGALAGLADRVGGDAVHGAEIHAAYPRRFRRDDVFAGVAAGFAAAARGGGAKRSSPPVSFTRRTRGIPPPRWITETDAVSIDVRWK